LFLPPESGWGGVGVWQQGLTRRSLDPQLPERQGIARPESGVTGGGPRWNGDAVPRSPHETGSPLPPASRRECARPRPARLRALLRRAADPRAVEGVKGGAGHWGNRTLVRARGAGRWADRRRGIGGERNGKIAASCAAVRVRVLLRFAMGWALPMPCLEIYLDGPASEPTRTSFLQTPIF